MDFNQLIADYVLPYVPTIVALASMIVVVLKACKAFKDLKKDVEDSNGVQELIAQNKRLLEDNQQLKKQLKAVVQRITRIQED